MTSKHEPHIVVLQKDLAPICEGCDGHGEVEMPVRGTSETTYVLIRCPMCSGTGRNEVRRRWNGCGND